MRDEAPLQRFARRLFLRGLSPVYIRRAMRELAEHREDLTAEAIENGLSSCEANDLAYRRMGDLDLLADAFVKRMQGSSWLGRHPLVSFCLLPLVAVIAWWTSLMSIAGWSTGALEWTADSALPPPNWDVLRTVIEWCPIAAATFLPMLFCWVARRSFRGFKWGFCACLILSLHSGLQFVRFNPPTAGERTGEFMVGYRISLGVIENAPLFALPLLVFAVFFLLHINKQKKKLTL